MDDVGRKLAELRELEFDNRVKIRTHAGGIADDIHKRLSFAFDESKFRTKQLKKAFASGDDFDVKNARMDVGWNGLNRIAHDFEEFQKTLLEIEEASGLRDLVPAGKMKHIRGFLVEAVETYPMLDRSGGESAKKRKKRLKEVRSRVCRKTRRLGKSGIIGDGPCGNAIAFLHACPLKVFRIEPEVGRSKGIIMGEPGDASVVWKSKSLSNMKWEMGITIGDDDYYGVHYECGDDHGFHGTENIKERKKEIEKIKALVAMDACENI